VLLRAFEPVRPAEGLFACPGPGVVNAPPVVTELLEKAGAWRTGAPAHAVNLTLLPHTPEDLDHFEVALGQGAATLLSRGYGDCRVEATAIPQIWRVRFFNSMGALILDTFEVTDMPEAVLAAREDFEDSAARLDEVFEAFR
jgi:hydrogenase-1 operon protein HyaF